MMASDRVARRGRKDDQREEKPAMTRAPMPPARALLGVESDVMVVSARRNERCLCAVPLGNFKS